MGGKMREANLLKDEFEVMPVTEETEEVIVPQEKMVPLKALEAERKKYKEKLDDPSVKLAKELSEKLQKTFGKDLSEIYNALDLADGDRIAEELGLSGKAFEFLRENQRQIECVKDKVRRQELYSQICELQGNKFYSDAMEHRSALEEYAVTNKCDIKTAYNVLFAEEKFEEIQRMTEQAIIENFEYKQGRKIDAVSGGDGIATGERLALTKDQLETAKAYGMTAEEYARYM